MSAAAPNAYPEAGPDALLTLMLEAAAAAAIVISRVYEGGFTAEQKRDGSPVTEADRQAEEVILGHLAATGLPVVAEESASEGRIPELGSRFFLVDPLDGTKEFLKRNGEFTVNIGLLEHGRPVAGVVLAPARGECFSGSAAGAFEYAYAAGALGAPRPIRVANAEAPILLASRSHGDGRLDRLMQRLLCSPDARTIGSSLKFGLLARGEGQLYPRLLPTSEWDTAAGQAVLEAAGGVVVQLDGQPLAYGNADRGFINPPFIAAVSRDVADQALQAIADLARGDAS